MQKYLLYNAVEPEELPTLRELSTMGKGPLQEHCQCQDYMEMSCGKPGAGAVGGTLLEGTDCCKESPALLCLGAQRWLW